jgi:hypothetical protein
MSNRHEIRSIVDLLKLSEEEFGRMLPDLAAWWGLCHQAIKSLGAEPTAFIWVDDGRAGEIHSLDLTVKGTGETTTIKGPAYSEESE